MLTRHLIALGFLLAAEFSVVVAHAGPMPSCIGATLSANSRILVVNELTFDNQDQAQAKKVLSSTFRVLSRYTDVNQGLRLDGPNSYWAHQLWSLIIKRGDRVPVVTCPYTLVTDDGEFLILVGYGFMGNSLSIYRRRDHTGYPSGGPGFDHGVLVREIPLSELWPAERIPQTITDHTPQWYSEGTFAFSPDNRTLTHKTRWGQTLSIDLATGKVTNQ